MNKNLKYGLIGAVIIAFSYGIFHFVIKNSGWYKKITRKIEVQNKK
jgi:hypothetical protein